MKPETQAIAFNDTEATQKNLHKLLRKTNVPTLPSVVQKLIEVCRDDKADFAQFARVIESDQGLASNILRVANSAYYGLRHKATTLDRAISALGIKYVKSISLGFHLATALGKFTTSGFNMEDFWRQSLLRAVLARQLAGAYCPKYSEEAFLIGLLQDCGIPFLVQVLGEQYARIWHQCKVSPASLFRLERELFEFDHVTAATVLMQQWSLPDLLAQPIRTHHARTVPQPSQDEQKQLCQIAYVTGTLSLNNPDSLCDDDLDLPEYSQKVFGIEKMEMMAILEQSKQEFTSVSQLFSGLLHDDQNIAELVLQAKDMLSNFNEELSCKVFDCEAEIKRLKATHADVPSNAGQSGNSPSTDDLTGLPTRNVLMDFLEKACKRVQEGKTSLTVLFLDIDGFKDINDKYGHIAGDGYLKDFAGILQSFFKSNGCVARYGGDEFVVALMGLQLKQTLQLTKGLLEKFHQRHPDLPVKQPDMSPNFSCSIGDLFCEIGSKPGCATHVIELADSEMYKIKNNSKNGFSYQILPTETSTPA